MKLNEAIAKLAITGEDGFITRTDGPTVRNAVTPAEHALHRYVVAGDKATRFDASGDDAAADDWELGSFAAKARALADELEAREAEARAKALADEAAKAKAAADEAAKSEAKAKAKKD